MSTAPNGFQTPKTNWQAADVPTPTDFNRVEGNLQAIEEGSRTVDQTQSPSGFAGSLRQFLDWISNRIKAILGTTNWYDSPPVTLTGAKNHIDNKSNPHGVTAAQVGAETPTGAQEKVNTHANLKNNPHSVTAAQVGAATPTQLAAKVDKPTSATSGNIAVFDGGAGKVKDGGAKVTDFLTSTCATGTYVGDGTASRNINVGFAPSIVFIYGYIESSISLFITSVNGGLVNKGKYLSGFGADNLEHDAYGSLTSNGFKTGSSNAAGNGSNELFRWIAFR